MFGSKRLAVGLALGLVDGLVGCRAPTQVTVELTTDVPCDDRPNTVAQVGRIGTHLEGHPPAIATFACSANGRIGSFVIAPSGGADDEFGVKVVLGHGDKSADRCKSDEPTGERLPGCIVARRGLRFLAHTELTLPIVLRTECDGVNCPDLSTTCVRGRCVPAIIRDPRACIGLGCDESILGVFDGGTTPGEAGPPVEPDASPPVCADEACIPPSCATPLACGTKSESCCVSLPLTGDRYLRHNDSAYPASVSNFALDKFEVTVGRFRAFVNDITTSQWRPPAGSGKHTHLPGGGLRDINRGGLESGWDSTWNAFLPAAKADWDHDLDDACTTTWTPAPGPNEFRPVTCLTWYESYAFCIWDKGFLPTYAEWNFAASGGPEQRHYPWGNTPEPDRMRANFCPDGCSDNRQAILVGSLPLGDGRYGQSDLAGNVTEWVLDLYPPVTNDFCADCVLGSSNLDTERTVAGGGFEGAAFNLATDIAGWDLPRARFYDNGLRCARSP